MNPIMNSVMDMQNMPQTQAPDPFLMNNLADKLQQFGSMINGNPQQIVQNLLSSGRMSQAQFQQYSQMANQILGRR